MTLRIITVTSLTASGAGFAAADNTGESVFIPRAVMEASGAGLIGMRCHADLVPNHNVADFRGGQGKANVQSHWMATYVTPFTHVDIPKAEADVLDVLAGGMASLYEIAAETGLETHVVHLIIGHLLRAKRISWRSFFAIDEADFDFGDA